jgi:hypothetical protein
MDDHHQQPIWPMIQGALDYVMNLAGELWSMVWRPAEDSQAKTLPVKDMCEVGKRDERVDGGTAGVGERWSEGGGGGEGKRVR